MNLFRVFDVCLLTLFKLFHFGGNDNKLPEGLETGKNGMRRIPPGKMIIVVMLMMVMMGLG